MSELSVLLVGDRKMIQLNRDYRGKNKTTDVLSFEASLPIHNSKAENILGDIVISVPVAESQARRSGTGFYEEICRLLIHGTLHLLGYEHEDSQYRARKMKNKEEEILSAIKEMD
jgi:probable rRNA maturation factor